MTDLRNRFPALTEGQHREWARFDGPAGTQVVDVAIEATSRWQRSGNNANSHGPFAAAQACDALFEQTQQTMGTFLGADPAGFMFGPSTTANVFTITRAIAHDLPPDAEIVCTRLDHDSNIAPWLMAAEDVGATVKLASFDVATGQLPTEAVTGLLTERTAWVAVTGASNAIGSMPDITAITAAAHQAGAKVMVDGVHLTPHAPVDIRSIGCDIYSTSAYKWYGPHLGITWLDPALIDSLHAYKVRPAPATGPGRLMTGTPAYENLAAVDAAARFIAEIGLDAIGRHEADVFGALLDGLGALDRVTVYGSDTAAGRAPTLMFTVDGLTPAQVAAALARDRIAVWDGDYYAVEVMASYAIEGAVRAGVSAYTSHDEVARLLASVAAL